jgi:hypothetical protein
VTRTVRAALILLGASPLAAQRPGPWIHWGAQAIPAFTQTNAVPGGRSLGELRIVQPVVMLHAGALGDRLRLMAAVDLEKWTILHGELTPGIWGESFVDRRHPHTVVHELMLFAPDLLGRLDGTVELFLAAGKGFVPFGTDDPMSRPVVRFPVNHHLSQVLERAVALAGVRVGSATLEGALFNGDEPVAAGSWPTWARFGDSWAVRLTVAPLPGLEGQASYAFVSSPENRPGAGPDDRKTSAAVRWERDRWYGHVEWARTSTARGAFRFHSVLAEAALTLSGHRPYVRFERTERPEEERIFGNRFRARRPLFENSILGITRWTILTAGDAVDLVQRPWRCSPFLEASWIGIARVGGGVFDPAVWYGREQGAALTVGIRLAAGMRMHRMGRYQPEPVDDMSPMHMP